MTLTITTTEVLGEEVDAVRWDGDDGEVRFMPFANMEDEGALAMARARFGIPVEPD